MVNFLKNNCLLRNIEFQNQNREGAFLFLVNYYQISQYQVQFIHLTQPLRYF